MNDICGPDPDPAVDADGEPVLVATDLVERVGAFEHAVGLLAIPSVPHAGLLQRGKAGHLLLEGLDGEHVVVMIDVEG